MPDIRFLQVVPIPGREVVQRNFANLLKNGHQVGKEKYSFRRLSLNERFMLMYRGYVLREAQQAEAPEGAEGHRKEARRQEEQEGSPSRMHSEMLLDVVLVATLLLLVEASEGDAPLRRAKWMEFALLFPFSSLRFQKGNPTIELIKRLPLDFWSLFSRRP
ncbi:hypothetical protein QR680_012698 [Steinernema hermaphroditum]|uniref:Uncharacterized protein n=1 Tax=Steinernema hermaphroditum TaxID=289476 RepID=A0AA39I5N3_9BILA|nr:hypothetical protein QR680_012698 [Steinernema hermaphroditum]